MRRVLPHPLLVLSLVLVWLLLTRFSLGHLILGTVIDELERQDKAVGLVTLCVAHGMGTAMIVERV